jgi:hypothetical protein
MVAKLGGAQPGAASDLQQEREGSSTIGQSAGLNRVC